ncbi:hypothetical protein, partial [Desulfobacula sp.]|uniref:hypothetical protein n=1 Tax=Desulfobacula sp. TaxID=2593537 RepID=UPI00261DEF46
WLSLMDVKFVQPRLYILRVKHEQHRYIITQKRQKKIKWRDVRLGFVRPLDSKFKIFAGKMGSYKSVVDQMYSAAVLAGMSPKTDMVG